MNKTVFKYEGVIHTNYVQRDQKLEKVVQRITVLCGWFIPTLSLQCSHQTSRTPGLKFGRLIRDLFDAEEYRVTPSLPKCLMCQLGTDTGRGVV